MEKAKEYALVTGASSGIGREFARQLAREGYGLLLVARRSERLQKLKDELKKEVSADIRILPADLSFRAECGLVAREASKLPIRIVINNAGFGDFGEFTETDLSREMQMIDVNVTAQHILLKKMLQYFEKKGESGYILNVASSAGLVPGGPYMASYYASKAYVVSLTRSVREEIRKKKSPVVVSALCPGPVDTEFNQVAHVKFALKSISAEKCVSIALKKLKSGKGIIVPTFKLRAGMLLARLAPPDFVVRIAGKQQEKKSGKD